MIDLTEDGFRAFATSLEAAIDRWGQVDGKELLARQKEQMDRLVAAETDFRRTLAKHHWGRNVYLAFISHVLDRRRNVLSARPYFRERQTVFAETISGALKARDWRKLAKFRINHGFVRFVINARRWHPSSKLVRLAKEIAAAREELAVTNMPLAISRAHLFYRRTRSFRSILTYMDLISLSCEGLLSAIDKFVPPFSQVFRAVAIGRMTGYFIESASETMVHFYPGDRRKLYRANKALGRGAKPISQLVAEVNYLLGGAQPTNEEELTSLMASASACVSLEQPTGTDDEGRERPLSAKVAAPDSDRPDVRVEEADARGKVARAIGLLPILEQKLLTLKGVEL